MTIFNRSNAPWIHNTGNYAHLRALPPEAYLRPENFITSWDSLESHKAAGTAEKRYQEGLELGRKSREVNISASGTWGADLLDGGYSSCPEGIGYHAHTAAFLHGILDSGVTVRVYRYGGPEGGTAIQERDMRVALIRTSKDLDDALEPLLGAISGSRGMSETEIAHEANLVIDRLNLSHWSNRPRATNAQMSTLASVRWPGIAGDAIRRLYSVLT